MISLANNIPFAFSRLKDDKTVQRLYDLCLSIEKDILSVARASSWLNIPGNETTARYASYNFLLVRDPIVKTVYDLIKESYLEMLQYLGRPRESMLIQCWVNIHRKHEALPKHAHPYPMHGHLTVNTDSTSTVYGDDDGVVIPNENGLLTLLGMPGVKHWATHYSSETGARVSIAFDLLPWNWVREPRWRVVYDERTFIPFD